MMTAQARLDEARKHVLGNTLLLDTILDFVVHEDDVVTVIPEIQTCRRVHSSWRQSISRCLRKRKEPVFHLRLPLTTPDGTIDPTKSLQEFVSLVTNSTWSESRVPPIFATILEDCFREECFQSVANYLSLIGSGLVRLFLQIPEQGWSTLLTTNLPFNFPILHDITVILGLSELPENKRDADEAGAYGGNSNVTSFIQQILSGCENLQNFSLLGGIFTDEHLPVGLENLPLPNTLATLTFIRGLTSQNLRGFMSSPLPNLTKLVLPAGPTPFEEELVLTILEKFSATLEHLVFYGISDKSINDPLQPKKLRLAEMKCLSTLSVSANSVEWSLGGCAIDPQNQQPVIKKLKFKNEILFQFCNLIPKLCLESVECVTVDLMSNWNEGDLSSIMLTFAVLVLETFPQIIRLNLDFDVIFGAAGLDYMFRNYKNLQDLRVTIRREKTRNVPLTTPDAMIALFLGMSLERVQGLQACKDSLEMEEFGDHNQLASLSNLKELRSLHLFYCDIDLVTPVDLDPLLYFALRTMPNLRHICIWTTCVVSPATANKWEETGRVLEVQEPRKSDLFRSPAALFPSP